MKQLLTRIGILALAVCALAACARKDNSIEPASSAAYAKPADSTAAGYNPLPGVIPVSPQLPGHTGTGPAAGSTAIGGLTGKQEAGGQTSGAPAPTGGDAASGQSAK